MNDALGKTNYHMHTRVQIVTAFKSQTTQHQHGRRMHKGFTFERSSPDPQGYIAVIQLGACKCEMIK